MASCGYIGKGKVYLDRIFVGNVSALNIAIAEEKIEQSDYTSPGGGNCAVVQRIDSVELSMTMTRFDADNLAKAVFGTAGDTIAASVTDESISAPAVLDDDTLLITAEMIDTTGTTTLTSDPAGTTYVEGTDYTVSPAGITVLAGGAITASDPLLASYDTLGTGVVQALTQSAQAYEVVFDGLNEADSGAPVTVKAYKVQFGPAADIPLIGDDFAELELTGDILLDDTVVGAGLSQYFTVAFAQ